MSNAQINFKKSSFATAALFAVSLAALTVASAAPKAISTRIDFRAAQPTTAGETPSSQITQSAKQFPVIKPLKRAKSRSVATRPIQKKSTAPLLARVSLPAPITSTPIFAPRATSIPASPPAVPLQTRVTNTRVASAFNATPSAPTAATLASRSGSPALLATIEKPGDKKKEADRVLLAQLEADLSSTQTRLNSTSQKLSAGQRQLMSFSNTLRNAIIEAGGDGAGLHPFVRIASRYAGTPYVWGGESRYGFDCSGFIIRVMRDLGYKAPPHSAAEQFKYGQPVAQALLKPGDIVFFANTYKPGISHVGIYIGKRRFIHAASTRQGTIVSSLDASPYRQKYAGARRLLTVRKKA